MHAEGWVSFGSLGLGFLLSQWAGLGSVSTRGGLVDGLISSGFGVWGLGFGVWGLGFGVWGLLVCGGPRFILGGGLWSWWGAWFAWFCG
jgi:hypothetical protein